MKHQALLSLKDESKKKISSAAIFILDFKGKSIFNILINQVVKIASVVLVESNFETSI